MTQRQKTRLGVYREERQFDKTQLRERLHGTFVHRDYAAHFFRWGWIARVIRNKVDVILDVGCGQDLALLKVLHMKRDYVPKLYVGVDLNRISPLPQWRWARFYPETNFIEAAPGLTRAHGPFTKIVCLEVIEHMGVADGAALLQRFREVLAPGGRVYLSTPVFNGTAAVNHIHEYTVPELQRAIERAGLTVEKRWGTFISANDVKRVAAPDELAVWKRLSAYYGGEVLATFLAPLYPDVSRNNLWVCEKRS